jgi:hypothetical protein
LKLAAEATLFTKARFEILPLTKTKTLDASRSLRNVVGKHNPALLLVTKDPAKLAGEADSSFVIEGVNTISAERNERRTGW